VALLGAAVALGANFLSPRGLRLTRDYFPNDRHSSAKLATTNAATAQAAGKSVSPAEELARRLRERGIGLLGIDQVSQSFQDPRCAQNLIIFIDARSDGDYVKGHIPGAYQFDYYRKENHLGTVLPACQAAQQIIIYCNGGNCEDSELTANLLQDAGIPAEKLFVYGGGFSEWATKSMTVETGQQGSGQILSSEQKLSGTGGADK